MNRKKISAVYSIVLLVAISVAVFAGVAIAQSKNTPPSIFKDYRNLTDFATKRGFYVIYTTGGKHNPGSVHPAGLAVDIRTWDHTPEEVEELMKAGKTAGLRVVDERCKPKNPKVVWGGQHVHVEISKKASKSEKNQCAESTSTPSKDIAATQKVYLTCRANFQKCNTACTGKKTGPGSSCFTSCSNKESTCISSNLKKIHSTPEPKLPPEPIPTPVSTGDLNYTVTINLTAKEHTECGPDCVGYVSDSNVSTTITLNNLLISSGSAGSASVTTSAPFTYSCSSTASGGKNGSLSESLNGYTFNISTTSPYETSKQGVILHYQGEPNYTYFENTCSGTTQDPVNLIKKALGKSIGGEGPLLKYVYNANGETVPFSGRDHDAAISNDLSSFEWSGTVTVTKIP